MYVEYLVLRANAEQGLFARVHAPKLNQSWETLQEALDELGQHEWDLCKPRHNIVYPGAELSRLAGAV